MHNIDYAIRYLTEKAAVLVEYGNSLPEGVTTEAFAEAELLRREAVKLQTIAKMHEPHYLTEEELLELVKNEKLISENGAPYLVVSSPGDENHPQLLMQTYPWDRCHFLLPKLFRDRRVTPYRRKTDD